MRLIWESIANILTISPMYFSLDILIKEFRNSSKFQMPASFSILHNILSSIKFHHSLTDFISIYYIGKHIYIHACLLDRKVITILINIFIIIIIIKLRYAQKHTVIDIVIEIVIEIIIITQFSVIFY